jgi:hypothetical protein
MSNGNGWLKRNLGLGGLFRNSASLVGFGADWGGRGVGWASGAYLRSRGNKHADAVERNIKKLAEFTRTTCKVTGNVGGAGIDMSVDAFGKTAGATARVVARTAGAEEGTVQLVGKVTEVVARASPGLVIGIGAGEVVEAALAASDTAGAAEHASALANLGGGSVDSRGGGMAAGEAILDTVTAAASLSSAAVPSTEADEEDDQ